MWNFPMKKEMEPGTEPESERTKNTHERQTFQFARIENSVEKETWPHKIVVVCAFFEKTYKLNKHQFYFRMHFCLADPI